MMLTSLTNTGGRDCTRTAHFVTCDGRMGWDRGLAFATHRQLLLAKDALDGSLAACLLVGRFRWIADAALAAHDAAAAGARLSLVSVVRVLRHSAEPLRVGAAAVDADVGSRAPRQASASVAWTPMEHGRNLGTLLTGRCNAGARRLELAPMLHERQAQWHWGANLDPQRDLARVYRVWKELVQPRFLRWHTQARMPGTCAPHRLILEAEPLERLVWQQRSAAVSLLPGSAPL